MFIVKQCFIIRFLFQMIVFGVLFYWVVFFLLKMKMFCIWNWKSLLDSGFYWVFVMVFNIWLIILMVRWNVCKSGSMVKFNCRLFMWKIYYQKIFLWVCRCGCCMEILLFNCYYSLSYWLVLKVLRQWFFVLKRVYFQYLFMVCSFIQRFIIVWKVYSCCVIL